MPRYKTRWEKATEDSMTLEGREQPQDLPSGKPSSSPHTLSSEPSLLAQHAQSPGFSYQCCIDQVWQSRPLIPALGRWRQKKVMIILSYWSKSDASVDHLRSCLKKKNLKKSCRIANGLHLESQRRLCMVTEGGYQHFKLLYLTDILKTFSDF